MNISLSTKTYLLKKSKSSVFKPKLIKQNGAQKWSEFLLLVFCSSPPWMCTLCTEHSPEHQNIENKRKNQTTWQHFCYSISTFKENDKLWFLFFMHSYSLLSRFFLFLSTMLFCMCINKCMNKEKQKKNYEVNNLKLFYQAEKLHMFITYIDFNINNNISSHVRFTFFSLLYWRHIDKF